MQPVGFGAFRESTDPGRRADSVKDPRMSRRRDAQPPKARAALAYVHPGEVSAGFMYSATRAMFHEAGTTGAPPILIAQHCSTGALVEARNEVVAHFLSTALEWLWCVDADMGFGPDALSRLLAAADPLARPIVGALCFGLKAMSAEDPETQALDLRCFPTLYRWVETDTDAGFQVIADYPRDQLVEVGATGAACFVVHRTALEQIRDKYGPTWFCKVTHPKGRTFSEDLSFFVRAAGADLPVYVDTGIRTSHLKGGVHLTEARWDEQEFVRANLTADSVDPVPV